MSDNLDKVCAICLEDLGEDESILQQGKRCDHKFHKACICSWILEKKQPNCPTCRKKLQAPDSDKESDVSEEEDSSEVDSSDSDSDDSDSSSRSSTSLWEASDSNEEDEEEDKFLENVELDQPRRILPGYESVKNKYTLGFCQTLETIEKHSNDHPSDSATLAKTTATELESMLESAARKYKADTLDRDRLFMKMEEFLVKAFEDKYGAINYSGARRIRLKHKLRSKEMDRFDRAYRPILDKGKKDDIKWMKTTRMLHKSCLYIKTHMNSFVEEHAITALSWMSNVF